MVSFVDNMKSIAIDNDKQLLTSPPTLTFIYRTFSIYYELSLTFFTNKREQETHFLYFCFQTPYCIANAHTIESHKIKMGYKVSVLKLVGVLPFFFVSVLCNTLETCLFCLLLMWKWLENMSTQAIKVNIESIVHIAQVDKENQNELGEL
jgi:hypothetical protein